MNMQKPEQSFSRKLRDARDEADLTQMQAVQLLDENGISISKHTLSNWENGKHEPQKAPPEQVLKIIISARENTTSPSSSSTDMTSKSQTDPIYSVEVTSEEGDHEISEHPIGHVEGDGALSRRGRQVFWILVRGDAMERTYRKRSLVPIQEFSSGESDIQEDDVYLVRLEGAVQLKRLQRLPNQRIRVISDNEAYPNTVLQVDQDVDFEVLGRVLV